MHESGKHENRMLDTEYADGCEAGCQKQKQYAKMHARRACIPEVRICMTALW